MGADRLELANTQYYGWGLLNRAALMPTREQVDRAHEVAERAMQRYRGKMQIIFVLPDYYEEYPKACYGGWGKLYLVVTPDGQVLPCHGATQHHDAHASRTCASIRSSGSGRSRRCSRRSAATPG